LLKELVELSSTKRRLRIEIPADTLEGEIQKSLRDVQRKTTIPGFRPGKAPLSLIEKKFGKNVETDVLEKTVTTFYAEAVKEAGITPLSGPDLEEALDFKRNEPLSLTITVDVRPKVEPLTYDNLTVKEIPVDVKDEEVEAVLKNLSEERASYESVDSAVEQGDLVTLDYSAEGGDDPAKDVVMKVGSGPYPEEFSSSLKGRRAGDEYQAEVGFPDDSPLPLAGRTSRLTIKIREVKRRVAEGVDDELAKDLGYDSLDALRERIRQNVTASKSRQADRIKEAELLNRLVAAHTFEVPEGMVNTELEGMTGEAMAASKGEKNEEELREELRPKAEKSVRASIILDLIGEKEGLTISEDEMKGEVLSMAQRFQVPPENIIKYHMARDGSLDRFRRGLFERKVLTTLVGRATVVKGDHA